MWIFQNDSFLSVVAHKQIPDALLVRSRIAGDIERAIPSAVVFEDADADYRYRAVVSRSEFKAALAAAVDRIDYPNFKGSIRRADGRRSEAYHSVWGVLYRAFGGYGGQGDPPTPTDDGSDPDDDSNVRTFLYGP